MGQTESKRAAGSRHFDHWQQRQPMGDGTVQPSQVNLLTMHRQDAHLLVLKHITLQAE
jgi:hypothetical protein